MRCLVIVVLFVSLCCDVFAQDVTDDVYMYNPFEDDFREIVVDTTLYYSPRGDETGVFRAMARYGFSFVSYRARGADERYTRASVDGLEISSQIGEYPDYALYSAIGSSVGRTDYFGGNTPAGFNTFNETNVYNVRASAASQGLGVTYVYSDKRYRTGLRFRAAGEMGKGWYYAMSARRRWGKDRCIDGVFTDAAVLSVAIEKRFRRGGTVSLFAIAAPQERGMKGWTEGIVYELTGDNLYNPYWGYLSGEKRNARINRDLTPLIVMRYDFPNVGNTRYSVSAGYRFGERSRSGLTWSDAANPSPDYYTNLPNHRKEPFAIDYLTALWRSGNVDVTQINWRRLYETNLFSSDSHSVYFQDERVERINNFQVALFAHNSREYGFAYDYGVRLRVDQSRFFRRVKDLMGGDYIPNRDPFTGAESDLNNPGRHIGEGGTYDYDYYMNRIKASAYGSLEYRTGRFNVLLGGELYAASWERDGLFDKEGFAGGSSYGRSGSKSFTAYLLSLVGRYYFAGSHYIAAQLFAGEYEPHYENIFLSPNYGNTVVVNPKTTKIASASVDYKLPISYFAELQVSCYAFRSDDETDIESYYDDMYGAYSTMVMTNISKTNIGAELGVKIAITDRLNLLAGFSVGNYVYDGNPSVSIFEDATNSTLLIEDTSYLDKFVHTSTPQTLAAVSLIYRTRSNWTFEAEWLYADRRYVSVNPLRRTERVASTMDSPEVRRECIRQQRLPAASVVNLGVTKGFELLGVRCFASVTLNNVLCRRDIIYGGYEPMRFDKVTVDGSTNYSPFPTRYNYSYPLTVLASFTCSF